MAKRKRKSYLATMILIIMLWGLLGAMIYWVDPELIKNILIPGLYLPFFLLFFPAMLLTLAVILTNSRKGLLGALGVTVFLILRVYQLGNLLSFLLILGIIISIDRYFN